jgi:hypothetical protein
VPPYEKATDGLTIGGSHAEQIDHQKVTTMVTLIG